LVQERLFLENQLVAIDLVEYERALAKLVIRATDSAYIHDLVELAVEEEIVSKQSELLLIFREITKNFYKILWKEEKGMYRYFVLKVGDLNEFRGF
jgi:hypothetical protein